MERGAKFLIKNKKADSPIYSNIFFIILNIMFFSILLIFVFKSSTGALVYEQAYAKKIALMIDSAEPYTEIKMNFSDGLKIVEENNKQRKEIVNIEEDKNKVIVNLGNRGGYGFKYFSDYSVEVDEEYFNDFLIIRVGRAIGDISGKSKGDLETVKKAILYARDNIVINRKCSCGSDETCLEYAEYIVEASSNNLIYDPLFLLSLMIQESSCTKAEECNLLGYCGLMQIPKSVEEWENPEKNINEGARILREKYDDSKEGRKFVEACTEEQKQKTYYGWEAALRGYNGWGCNKLYPEQDYFVENIIERYNKLRENV